MKLSREVLKISKMRKNLILLFLATTVSAPVIAQTVEMDTVYRPRTYSLKVEQFRSYPDSENDVVFLGNSLTEYTDWNELLQLPEVRNRGISGDTSFGILERLDEVTEGKPAKIFLLVGINDISRNVPASLILKNHQKIISRIKKETPGTRIYLQTLLPVNNEFSRYKNHYNKDEVIKKVNDGLRELARKEEITLVDLHPHFLNEKKKLDKEFTEEGLHLNAKGYQLWAQVLKPYILE